MFALHAPGRVDRGAPLPSHVVENLAAITPSILPGCDGLTVDVLLDQYYLLAERGLVPKPLGDYRRAS